MSAKILEPNTVKVEEKPVDAQGLVEVQPSVEILVSPEPESAKFDKVTFEPVNSDKLTTSLDAELPQKMNQPVKVKMPPRPYP